MLKECHLQRGERGYVLDLPDATMSEPSGTQKKQKEKRDNNVHEAKKGKLNVPDEPLLYVKKNTKQLLRKEKMPRRRKK